MSSNQKVHHFPQNTISLPDGSTRTFDLMAFEYVDMGVVTWSMSESLIAIYSDADQKKKVDVHQLVRHLKLQWGACMSKLGWKLDDVLFPTRKAILSACKMGKPGPEQSAFNRNTWTCTTVGFVCLLLHVGSCSVGARRQLAKQVLEVWILKAMSIPDVEAEFAGMADGAAQGSCMCDNVDGECRHMRGAISIMNAWDSSPAEKLTALCSEMWSLIWLCQDAVAFGKWLLKIMSLNADTGLNDRVSTNNVLKMDEDRVRGGRRRVYSDAFIEELTLSLAKKGKAINGSAQARVEGLSYGRLYEWQSKALLDMRSAMTERFGVHAGTFCLCEDATKLGKPAMEVSD